MIIETTINLKNKSKEELILLLNESLGVIEKLQKENQTLKSFVSGIFNENIEKDFISVQKVKDKIEKIKQEKKKYGNCLIEMYEDELVNRDIKILQELIEEREEK